MAENTDQEKKSAAEASKGSTTEHELKLAGGTLPFVAVADWLVLRKQEKPVAEIFFVYYRAVQTPDAPKRPVTFVFNGGPGAASAYLHVGALGPKRVCFATDGTILPSPTKLADNESTWLKFTDLVFIDPVGTGFSRVLPADSAPSGDDKAAKAKPAGEEKENEEFYQVNRDLESLGEFISKFLSKFGLWSRPVYIAGESYGGFRVGKLARKLQEGYGVGLCGAILISPALEISLLEGSDYDIAMWTDLFPSLVAAAVHHGKSRAVAAGQAPESFLPEVERFAMNDLVRLLALGTGGGLPEHAEILKRAADYLGLDADYVADKAGRISMFDFVRRLLKRERKVLGLYDASATAVDPFPDRDTFHGADPTLSGVERVFTAGINIHLRETLGVQSERDYQLLSLKVNEAWKVDSRKHALETQLGATDDLRYAMALNPHMKVYVTHGIYDLVTPYYSSTRLAALMRLTPEQRQKLTVRHFRGGHMFYAWEESRLAFRDSMLEFYQRV